MHRRLQRCKPSLTIFIFIFLCCIAYLRHTWQHKNYIRAKISNHKHSQLNYAYENFEFIRIKNLNSYFILIAVKQTSIKHVQLTHLGWLTNQELAETFQILDKADAFLLDNEILQGVQFLDKSPDKNRKLRVETFNKMRILYDRLNGRGDSYNEDVYITYGVSISNFSKLNEEIVSRLNSKCEYIHHVNDGMFSGEKLLTSMSLKCRMMTIHVAIIYERGDFLWTLGNGVDIRDSPKQIFNDVSRALRRFEIVSIIDEVLNVFNVPVNIKNYLYDYNHSKFLECDWRLAMKNFNFRYAQNDTINDIVKPIVHYIGDSLEKMYKRYWLSGGTLLGWYRDCGVIPHTKDVDLAFLAEDYEEAVMEQFLGNENVRVWGTLGFLNDSYEMRLMNNHFSLDIFLVYPLNDTHRWCGYQVDRAKYRRFLPNFQEFCSADLLNQKYMIPCDPVQYLDNEYGKFNWQKPLAKKYHWKNLKFEEYWPNSKWSQAVKFYDQNGKLLWKKTMNYIKKFSSNKP